VEQVFSASLINPPISLYYVQGLNLSSGPTVTTALFGIYGMLGLGLTLFLPPARDAGRNVGRAPLKLSFWSLNFGLIFMVNLQHASRWDCCRHGHRLNSGTWYRPVPRSSLQSGSHARLCAG